MTRAETISQLRTLIRIAEHYRNAIYMTPPVTFTERINAMINGTVPYFEWSENGHKFSACYRVYINQEHVFAKGEYTRDGKKTNLLAVKNSLKRLEMEENNHV